MSTPSSAAGTLAPLTPAAGTPAAAATIEPYRPTILGGARSGREAADVAEAWGLLALAHGLVKFASFERLVKLVAARPTHGLVPPAERAERTAAAIAALNRARVYYFRRAWCLQSAVAAVWLLRRRGVPAELVVGVRKVPFAAHAWVEVDGRPVLNVRPDQQRDYRAITRC